MSELGQGTIPAIGPAPTLQTAAGNQPYSNVQSLMLAVMMMMMMMAVMRKVLMLMLMMLMMVVVMTVMAMMATIR